MKPHFEKTLNVMNCRKICVTTIEVSRTYDIWRINEINNIDNIFDIKALTSLVPISSG